MRIAEHAYEGNAGIQALLARIIRWRVHPVWYAAGLIVGLYWSVFHLPLHLPGNWYQGFPILPTILILIGYSILVTWIFQNTNGSAWMTLLFHGTLNSLTPLTSGMDQIQAWWLRALVFCSLALLVAILSGRKFWQQGKPVLRQAQ